MRHDQFGPIKCVDVSLTERVDGADYAPFDLYIEPIAALKLTDLQPRGMSDAQWVQKLDDHYPAVVAFLENRYDAFLDFADTQDNRWDDIEMHFRVQVPSREITQEEALDIGWNETKAVQLYNESDHSIYGTENLERLLNEAMDAAVVVPRNPYDIVRAAEPRGGSDIDAEVELRARRAWDPGCDRCGHRVIELHRDLESALRTIAGLEEDLRISRSAHAQSINELTRGIGGVTSLQMPKNDRA